MIESMHNDSLAHGFLHISVHRRLRTIRFAVQRVYVKVLVRPNLSESSRDQGRR